MDPKQCTARGGEKRGEGKARKAEEAEGRGGQAPKGKGGREKQKASGCGNDAKRLYGLSIQNHIAYRLPCLTTICHCISVSNLHHNLD